MDLNHGIVFKSLWQGSMIGRSDAQLVFIFLLAHTDPDDQVDTHPGMIAALTGLPQDRVRAALDYLESDDPESRNPNHDGRRISRLDEHRDWGWKILNRALYKELYQKEKHRRLDRKLKKEKRLLLSTDVYPSLPESTQAVCSMQYAVGIEEEESKPLSADADFLAVWLKYPHYRSRSRKADSLRVWKRLKPNLSEVLSGLEICMASPDWVKDEGEFVPGMQVWLRGRGWDCSNGNGIAPEIKPHRPEMSVEERLAQINRGRE